MPSSSSPRELQFDTMDDPFASVTPPFLPFKRKLQLPATAFKHHQGFRLALPLPQPSAAPDIAPPDASCPPDSLNCGENISKSAVEDLLDIPEPRFAGGCSILDEEDDPKLEHCVEEEEQSAVRANWESGGGPSASTVGQARSEIGGRDFGSDFLLDDESWDWDFDIGINKGVQWYRNGANQSMKNVAADVRAVSLIESEQFGNHKETCESDSNREFCDREEKVVLNESVFEFESSKFSGDEEMVPRQISFLNQPSCAENDCSERGSHDNGFRESFYNSGSDWSSLYDVDEYGIPCSGTDEAEIKNEQKSHFYKNDDKSQEEVVGKGGDAEKSRKNSCTKLVQSNLMAYWGTKPESVKKIRQTVFGSSGIGAVCVPDFWSKFTGSSESSPLIAVKTGNVGQSFRRNFRPKDIRGGISPGIRVPLPTRRCPFYKKIPGTPFTVDAFRYGSVEGCLAYFLTHFHSDHYGGLTKSWSHGPIYCSPVTARLLALCLSIDERWIFPIQLGITHVIEGVKVKMMEANHCPGATIILFLLKNGQSILHTGDFRASKEMENYRDLQGVRINMLYLDTTYCNPRYRFPSQKDVINFVIHITQAALKKNAKTLVVVGAYSIGKERVYLGIAEALEVQIFAERRRSRILSSLEWPELSGRVTTDSGSTMLHVLPIGFLRPEMLKEYLQCFRRFTSVLAFRPTGWTYSEKTGNQLHLLKPVTSGPVTIYGVPYSEHSSFIELRDFVQFFKPENIIPTVNNGRPSERERMQSLFRQWLAKGSNNL